MIAAAIARVESGAIDEEKAFKFERRRRRSRDLLDTTSLSWSSVDVVNVDDNCETPAEKNVRCDEPEKHQFRAGVNLQPSRDSKEISIIRQNLEGTGPLRTRCRLLRAPPPARATQMLPLHVHARSVRRLGRGCYRRAHRRGARAEALARSQ